MVARTFVVTLLTSLSLYGCGRAGFEDGAGLTGALQLASCPDGMAGAVVDDLPYCIERVPRGWDLWVNARDSCSALERRLCGDEEWARACTELELEGMTDDWEWVADLVSPDIARKRGGGSCDGQSTHAVDSGGYSYRCCADR